MVLKSTMLKIVMGPKKDEIKRGWRESPNEGSCDLQMSRLVHVAHMGQKRAETGNLKE